MEDIRLLNKKFMFMAIFLVSLLAVSAVSASDINDTDDAVTGKIAIDVMGINDDSNCVVSSSYNDCVSVNEGTFTDLQNIINNASSDSTISLQKNFLYDDSVDSNPVKINKSITINGNGHTIDALKKSRIFNIDQGNVVLKNIKFCNGANAIYSSSNDVIVENCTFVNNSAGNSISYGYGGAIYSCGNVVNCTFVNNSANYGGAIYNCSDIVNCSFINNFADDTYNCYGGAIYRCEDVVNCSFVNNYAQDHYAESCGGAIYSCGNVVNSTFVNSNAINGGAIYTSSGVVDNCGFISNSAYYGGAIYSCSEVVNCNFKKNYAETDGGAIYFKEDGSVSDCSFVNNYAHDGGAIYFKEDGSVSDCSFVNNSARYCGGAVIAGDVVNCSFVNNHADSYGGAIYDSDVVNCSFVNNSACYGGAIYLNDFNGNLVFVSDCSFVNNHADSNGGGISGSDYSSISVFNCSFADNSAADYGGAICYADAVNCSFVNNSAEQGGAIYDGGALNCSFISNSAEVGGAVASRNSVVNCTFINNSAEQGGAVAWCNYVIICSFVDNSAKEHGGAIFSGYNILNCSFVNNFAKEYGGAISYLADDVVNCSFVNNSAEYRGGAIYCEFGGSIFNSSFVNNTAGRGAALYNPLYVEKCSFRNNVANSKSNVYYMSDLEDLEDVGNIFVDCDILGEDVIYTGILNWEEKLILSLGYDINGSVSIKISGKTFYPTYKKIGEKYYAYFDINGITPGINDVNVFYDGDSTKTPINITVPVYIGSKISISASDVDKYYGGSDKFIVTLKDGDVPISSEFINITINGKTSTVKTDSKGQASIDLNLPVGKYDATAVYEYVSTTSKVNVKSTLTTADITSTYLNSKVTATFLNTDGSALASKQVTFKVYGKDYTATTNGNGVATANIDLGVGNYTVTAVNPINNEQKEFNLVINKASSNISLAYAQSSGVTTLTATLTPSTASGSVIFNVNGVNKTAAIKSGKATLTLKDLEAGNYTAAAFYNGDNNLNASISDTIAFNVDDVYPVLTAKGVTKTYGTSTKLTVYLKDSKGNAIANAKVNVNINKKVTPITTNSDGRATMAIGQAPGTYNAKITYPGAKEITAKIVVKKATPKITAKAKTFKKSVKTKKYTIVLKVNNKVMKSTKVTLKVNKKTYSAKTNSKGVATFKITKLTKVNKYTATVKYAGSKYYNAKSVNVKFTVR